MDMIYYSVQIEIEVTDVSLHEAFAAIDDVSFSQDVENCGVLPPNSPPPSEFNQELEVLGLIITILPEISFETYIVQVIALQHNGRHPVLVAC
jgi:hypothetical protein